jgi:hypothetical protein
MRTDEVLNVAKGPGHALLARLHVDGLEPRPDIRHDLL